MFQDCSRRFLKVLQCTYKENKPRLLEAMFFYQIRIFWTINVIFKSGHYFRTRRFLIDWGLTISQLYQGGQFTYSCIFLFSHTSTPYNNLPKQLAAFPLSLSPLVEDEWHMSDWLLSTVRKKVGWVGIQTHNPWIDSMRRYWLSYRDSAKNKLRPLLAIFFNGSE